MLSLPNPTSLSLCKSYLATCSPHKMCPVTCYWGSGALPLVACSKGAPPALSLCMWAGKDILMAVHSSSF